ncbi:MAG: helix-turn-helix domain-containing protein [Tateyamaria sp.]|uniref:helix-turn-helix transcriptional regulator n=1 Tax=Tateyamaria sp. TaxID=1929288 RepID=UPI00329FBE86
MTDLLLTDREVAERLGVSKATVWRHAASGSLPKPVKLSHSSRWPESDIQAAVEQLKAQRDSEAA